MPRRQPVISGAEENSGKTGLASSHGKQPSTGGEAANFCQQISMDRTTQCVSSVKIAEQQHKLHSRRVLPWRNFLSPEFGAKFQRKVT